MFIRSYDFIRGFFLESDIKGFPLAFFFFIFSKNFFFQQEAPATQCRHSLFSQNFVDSKLSGGCEAQFLSKCIRQ